MEIIKKTNIDFLGLRKAAFVLSSIFVILGIICAVMISLGRANLGIDFAGGASANLIFEKPVQLEAARKAMDAAGLKGAELQTSVGETHISLLLVNPEGMNLAALGDKITAAMKDAGFSDYTRLEQPANEGEPLQLWVLDTTTAPVEKIKAAVDASIKAIGGAKQELTEFDNCPKVMFRIKKTDIPTGQVIDKITGAFQNAFPDNKVIVDSSSAIGPTVGKALQKDALWAITIALICIIIYIAWRFEFKFGLAATVATFHDVLMVLGIFYILNKEITLLVVTALLTIAGYSLTDTVVVFDRIRENLKLRQKDNLIDIINDSINEVLSRTVVTSLTTFLTVLALYILGGEVLRGFALAMMLGIAVGTYSSIFVASPLLYVWRGKKGGRLIKAAMLSKQPERAGAPKPVIAAEPAAAPAPKPQPVPEEKPAQSKPAQAGKKKGGRGTKSYKGKR